MKSLCLFIIPFVAIISCSAPRTAQVVSPDGSVKFVLFKNNANQLGYEVYKNDSLIMEFSQLGIATTNQNFSENVYIEHISESIQQSDNYQLITGKQTIINSAYTTSTVKVSNNNSQELFADIRVYDDGVAFRYRLTGDTTVTDTLIIESTTFNLPEPGLAWMHPYDTIAPWAPAYETFYEDAIDIGTTAPQNKNGWAFPMLFYSNETWLLISDANITAEDAGMHIEAEAENGEYSLRFPEKEEANNLYEQKPVINYPYTTPWRTIICGNNLETIVESNMITNLAAPNKLENTDWIIPGRSSWSWWSDGPSTKDYNKLKAFVDFSAKMGWEYSLVDANWNHMTNGNLEKLAKYAEDNGVGLLVWYNSGHRHNTITEQPRDLMFDRETRRKEMEWLHSIGVKGIKVDFFQSDKPRIIQQYIEILEDAADYEILVNFHGCTLPRGWRRTYPNLMTLESIRGGEAYRFDKNYPTYGPIHTNIATYTRNVIGPMDYTPVTLSESTYPHLTTYTHQLAQPIIFESGIQHFADHYAAYNALPDYAIQYLKDIPVVWEQTEFISGYPGKYTIMARKNGNKWYIAGLNGESRDKELVIDFKFLQDGTHTMQLVTDGTSQKELKQSTIEVTNNSEQTIYMKPYGGFYGVIE